MNDSVLKKENNFGALRLLFASLVIVSHSPAILTGSPSNEPHYGPLTLGAIAVDGFFIVSGYLIAKSFVGSVGVLDYFRKRILRIYPGFAVNFLLCLLVLAPFVGAGLSVFHPKVLGPEILRLAILSEPKAPGAFASMPVPALNGSAWTISYEFRCYILVPLVGSIGALKNFRFGLLVVAIAGLIISALNVLPETSGILFVMFGTPPQTVRLTAVFAVGTLFYLYRDRVEYGGRQALVAAASLLVAPFFPTITELALATCGGYLIFWFAFEWKVLRLSTFSNKTDLSYGIYLYAWPIQNSIVYFEFWDKPVASIVDSPDPFGGSSLH